MRPVRLELSAFGPFADEQTLDFDALRGRRLLLIHGPTGSGKTTILDAICFALFGDTSGAERQGSQMRCVYASPSRMTRVEFDFWLGDRRLRVLRIPAQERPRRRGGGSTRQAHEATLWDRTGTENPTSEGRVLASGVTEVNAAIEELFGFDARQFRQVVMLPQGQFRRFLTAESKEKEAILQRLFQTERYARVAEALRDRANSLRRTIQDEQLKAQTLLQHVAVQSADELGALVEQSQQQLDQVRVELPLRKQRREQAQAALEQSRQVQSALTELAAAEQTLAELAQRRPEMQQLRAQVEAADRALPLQDVEREHHARRTEAAQAEEAHERAEHEARAARQRQAACLVAAQAERKREGEREQAQSELFALRGFVGKVDKLADHQLELRRREQDERSRRAELGGLREEQSRLLGEADRLRAENQRAESEAGRLEEFELRRAQADSALQQRRALSDAEASRRAAEQVAQKAAEQLQSAVGGLLATRQHRDRLEQRWREGQAGALARELVPGQPCLVCGSREHPHPATAPDELPTEADLRSARSRVREAEATELRLREAEAEARAARGGTGARARALRTQLGSDADQDEAQLRSRAAESERAVVGAREARAESKALAARVQALEPRLRQLCEAVEAEQGLLQAAEVALASERTAVVELAADLPEPLRSKPALTSAIAAAERRCEALAAELEQANARAQEATARLVEAEAKLAESAVVRHAAEQRAAALENLLGRRRVEAGFDSVEAYQQAQAWISRRSEFDAKVRGFEGDLHAAEDRRLRAQEGAAGLSAPDLDALGAAHAEANERYEHAISEEASHQQECARLRRVQKEHADVLLSLRRCSREWELVEHVAQVALGRPPYQVSFQRYVLGSLLDDALSLASTRLRRMSQGRYRLVRSTEIEHKGKAAGLDLQVIDEYTGTRRAVATLSGGESFLAALGLSLGLADVVQAYSGGIHLDTLFIDEGFGTLDPDALELALDTLTALQSEGRLVGIISHVPELAARISARLSVTPTGHGSRACFVVD